MGQIVANENIELVNDFSWVKMIEQANSINIPTMANISRLLDEEQRKGKK